LELVLELHPGQPMDLDENEETEHQHEPAEDRVEEFCQ